MTRRTVALVALVCFFAQPVHAQGAGLAAVRAELASYDLAGTRTLDALRALGPIAAGGAHDALEARYLRAMAATDLHVAALALGDAGLDERLAAAMGVPPDGLAEELRSELRAAQTGLYRSAVTDELALLRRAQDVVGATGLGEVHQPRDAAMVILTAGREARAHALSGRGVSRGRRVGDGPAWLVGPESAHAGELRDALLAYDTATRGVRDGDPLLAALSSAIDAARDALLAYELRASPSTALDPTVTIAAADAAASAGDVPDVLVVVEAGRVAITCGARMHVTLAGELATTLPSHACPEPGHVLAVALPASLPTVPQPIDSLVAAFTALALPSTAVIAIAPTESTPTHVFTRTLRSLARANLTATLLALGTATDLRTSPLVLATAADAPSVTIHVRLGGYAIERAHGHDTQVPRVRGASGLAYDHAALTAALASDTITGAAVDGMGPVPMVEVVRAMRVLASSGARVTLALP